MISAIVAALSFVAIIVTTSLLVVKGTDLKKRYDDRLRSMTDQMNNANYYNAQVDKQNAQSITDVRKTYASKDDIARSVDTKNLSTAKVKAVDLRAGSVTGDVLKAGTSMADNLRANKLVSPGAVVGQLESSVLSAKRINLVGTDDSKSAISFDSSGVSGEYLLQRGVADDSRNMMLRMPTGAKLNVPGAGGSGVEIDPHGSSVGFGEKWKLGRFENPEAKRAMINYDMLGVQFDNKEVLGMYNVGGFEFSRVRGWVDVNNDRGSMLSVSASDGEPIFIGTGRDGKGIASWGEKPVTVHSTAGFEADGLRTTSNAATIHRVRFADEGDGDANFVNDETNARRFMIYGNKAEDGQTKKVGVADALDVYGNMQSVDWAVGQNVYGRDHVTAGAWAAWMRSDGMIQGKNIDVSDLSIGDTVQGRKGVAAGDWKAFMRSDGSIEGETVRASDGISAKTLSAKESVSSGNSSMKSNGSIAGVSGAFSKSVDVGSVGLRSDGSVVAGTVNASSGVFSPQLNASSGVVAPGVSSKPGVADWFRINSNNASSAGTAIHGAAAVSKGLSVGEIDATVPAGTIRASSNLCVNKSCLSESDVRRLAAADKICINNTCLSETDLKRILQNLSVS